MNIMPRTIWELFRLDIGSQYRENMLGMLWIILQPAAHIVVFATVFTLIKIGRGDYVMYLVAGLVPWQLLLASVNNGARSVIKRGGLLKAGCQIPIVNFQLADILKHSYIFTVSIIIMYIGAAWYYDSFHWNVLWYPLAMVPLILTCFFISIVLGYITVYFRDVGQIIQVVTRPLLWTMPIIYQMERMPEQYRYIFDWHPFYILIKPSQLILYYQEPINWVMFAKGMGVVAITAILAYFAVRLLKRNAVYYL